MTQPTAPVRGRVRGWQAAAAVSHCSASYLRKLASRGELVATKADDGIYELDVAELEALRGRLGRESSRGRDIAHGPEVNAMRELNAGVALAEVAVNQGLDADSAERIHAGWLRLREQDLSPPSVPARLRSLEAAMAVLQRTFGQSLCAAVGPTYRCAGCGAQGLVAARVRCTGCDRQEDIGYFPPCDAGEGT